MGYKETIKNVLKTIWGIQDRYFEINLSTENGQEQIKELSPKQVKARFKINVLGKFLKPVYIDMYITVWGDIKYKVVYNKLGSKYDSFLNTFIQAIVTELTHDIRNELEIYKNNIKKSA